MGYSTERFIKPIDPNLICGICNGVLESPVLTPCGHSFCTNCLTTWLSKPDANTCPECRAWININSFKPILSLRNFIQSLEVMCINSSRGCNAVMKLDNQQSHLMLCKFMPVTCVGCQTAVNTSELADHQMKCKAIESILDADDNLNSPSTGSSRTFFNARQYSGRLTSHNLPKHISIITQETRFMRMQTKISSLEKQVGRLLENLKESHTRNTILYHQYRNAQDELYDQQRLNKYKFPFFKSWASTHSLNSFEFTISKPKDIAKLSLFIARNLLDMPRYVDSNYVFYAIRSCYLSQFTGIRSERNHDIHMLLATAYASNWFTADQKTFLECWLQCVLQCHGCKQLIEA